MRTTLLRSGALTLLVLVSGAPALPASATSPFLASRHTIVELGELLPGGVEVAGRPGGGWLVAWPGWGYPEGQFHARRIFPDGSLGGVFATPVLLELDFNIAALGVAPSGRWATAWGVDDIDTVHAGLFEPNGALVRELDLTVPGERVGGRTFIPEAVIDFADDGSFVIAWKTEAPDPPMGTDLVVARFDADGERVAGPLRINVSREGLVRPRGIAVTSAGVVVLWTEGAGPANDDLPASVRIRILGHDLSSVAGGAVIVAEQNGARPLHAALAAAEDGRFLVAWGSHIPFEPMQLLARPFAPSGAPLGPPVVVSSASVIGPVEAVVTPQGLAWIAWGDMSTTVRLRALGLDGRLLGPVESTGLAHHPTVPNLAVGPGGRLITVSYEPRGITRAAILGGDIPPPQHVLTSPRLPGYRAWVRITPPGGEPIWGTEEPECLAEALCASGALPGRVEVIVRVIGPRPNGFLWPLVVKLSPSQVEVWIEQEATDEVRYYLLPGAGPGDTTLPGLFDPFGFEPE